MTRGPTATVVVAARDRWSLAPSTLERLLVRTDPRHPVVVVDAGSPRRVAAVFDRAAATGRIRVARRPRFLGSNEAKNVGADGVRTEWIAFVENDAVPSDGWLDALLDVGESRGAASVFPAYLEPTRHGAAVVHGTGADLEVHDGEPGVVRERQHHIGRPWREVCPELEAVARVQSEPHVVVVRRELLDTMGGLDEGFLGWFDHTDLALHHRRLGASSWFVPRVTCHYLSPPPVAFGDLPSFLLRWGGDWFDRSLAHLCANWNLDPLDREWERHATYRTAVRRSVLTPWARVNALVDHAAAPVDRWIAHRWHAERARAASEGLLGSVTYGGSRVDAE